MACLCVWVETCLLNCEKPLLKREVKRWKVNGGVNRRSVMSTNVSPQQNSTTKFFFFQHTTTVDGDSALYT